MDTTGSDASAGNEGSDLPKFVVFKSLSNEKLLCPGGVHRYMKFEATDAVSWGVKHEVQNANSERGLVHIRCCDTGKYWCWGLTEDSRHFVTAQADQPEEDKTKRNCTLIKPSHTTKGNVKVFKLEVMWIGKWWDVGVNDMGYLFDRGEEDFLISNWESQQANQLQGPFVGNENMDTIGSNASVGNKGLDLPKFAAFNSFLNKDYLRPAEEDRYIKFMAVEAISWGVKHEILKARSELGLVHIRCCDTGKYWSWNQTGNYIIAQANQPGEDKDSKACTLIRPSKYTKDGVSVINFQASYQGIWQSIGGDSAGYLQIGGEDFVISNIESLQPVANDEMVLPKFVMFNTLSNKKYLRPGGVHRYMKFEAVDAVRWGVKHEVQNAKYERGLVHIRCCDTGKYWSWGLTHDSGHFVTAQVDQPVEDKTKTGCTLISPFHTTEGDVKVVKLKVWWNGKWWPVGVNDAGYLFDRGEESFLISNWESEQANQPQEAIISAENMDTADFEASIENEGLELPKFVAFNSLWSKKYLKTYNGNADIYVRFWEDNVQDLGIKYEIQKAKCEGELIHIKCCDTGKYWSRGSGYSENNIVSTATQPEENKNIATCTLIKPSQYTKDGETVVNFQIMYNGTWWSIGVEGDGCLERGGEDFIVSNWETLKMGHTRSPSGACVLDSITLKLCSTNYRTWKELMLTFLANQDLSGFVDGTIKPPNKPPSVWEEAHRAYTEWKGSDDLVRGWILATVTENILRQVMNLVTAREVWMELRRIFTSTFQLSYLELIDSKDQKRGQMVSQYIELHKAALTARWETANKFLDKHPNAVSQPITSSLETALMVAVRSPKRNDFVKKLIEKVQKMESVFEKVKEMESMVEKVKAKVKGMESMVENEKEMESMVENEKEMESMVEKVKGMESMAEKVKGMESMAEKVKEMESMIKNVKGMESIVENVKEMESMVETVKGMESMAEKVKGMESMAEKVKEMESMIKNVKGMESIVENVKEMESMVETVKGMESMVENVKGMESMLQKKGAWLALKDISGATALHAAVDGGNLKAAKWLVQENPKLANMPDKHGTLAVHVAAGLGNREMVDFLKDTTTNLSKNDQAGLKFLHFLASSGLYDEPCFQLIDNTGHYIGS